MINVTDPKANHQEIALKCTTTYEFGVKAWNELGGSDFPSKAWPITTEGSKLVQGDTKAKSISGKGLIL